MFHISPRTHCTLKILLTLSVSKLLSFLDHPMKWSVTSIKSLHLPCLKWTWIDHWSLIVIVEPALLGSRFKRTVVPLGLMTAAASLCYPAQAVAVVKVISFNANLMRTTSPLTAKLSLSFLSQVTGKKVYASGQWSSAVVSSLFASKPQEPVTKDPTSPQPQVIISTYFMSNPLYLGRFLTLFALMLLDC